MFNLIKKDLILQKNLLLVYLLVLVLLLSSGFHFGFIVVLLSSLFLFNSQYYDDKEKSHVLLNSLPYTRKEIVSSKYVGGILFALLIILLSYIGSLFISEAAVASPVKTIAIGFFCILLFISITMPIFYKFTQQFVFVAFAIFFALSFFVFSKLSDFINNHMGELVLYISGIEDSVLLLSIMAVAAACYALSWKLSIRIYNQRAF